MSGNFDLSDTVSESLEAHIHDIIGICIMYPAHNTVIPRLITWREVLFGHQWAEGAYQKIRSWVQVH